MQQKTCGNYVLVDRIAKGGMAEVYLGRTTGAFGVDRLVAVKMLLPMRAESKQSVAMFIDEARLAVELTHVNIVQIYELGVSDGRYYIAMEYVPGADLAEILRRLRKAGDPMPIAHASYLTYCVCAALDYAHTRLAADGEPLNIVHRDVSPQNVLVGDEGGVKVADFGIALSNVRLAQTVGAKLKGKVCYMSPEQAWGRKLDARSDLFSVGTVLYQLLTGVVPFDGKSELDVVYKVRDCQVTPPRELRADIPEELEAIVLRAMAQDPNARFADAEAMHRALEPFIVVGGRPFGARDLRDFIAGLRRSDSEQPRRDLDQLLAADKDVEVEAPPADWSEIAVTQLVEMEVGESAILAVHQPWAAQTGLRSIERSATRDMPRMPTVELEEVVGAVGADAFADLVDSDGTGVEVVTGHEGAAPPVAVLDEADESWTVPEIEHSQLQTPGVVDAEAVEDAEHESEQSPPARPHRMLRPVVAGTVVLVTAALIGIATRSQEQRVEEPVEPSSSVEIERAPVAVSPTATRTMNELPPSTRVEVVRLRRGLASLMRARGLGRGDSSDLDLVLDQLAAAVEDEQWSEAYVHAEGAMIVASDLEVSVRMVRIKLGRMERRVERVKDAGIREALAVAIVEGRALLEEGEIEEANVRLHEAIVAGFAAARGFADGGGTPPEPADGARLEATENDPVATDAANEP